MRLAYRCFLAAVILGSVSAAEEGPTPDVETVRQAIQKFHTDPLDIHGETARNIFRYAEESSDVELVLNKKVVSFMDNQKEHYNERSTLLLAFIVGNVEEQWARHQAKDNSYAGVLQVIATYRQLQSANPLLRIPEVEELIDLQKRGDLRKYIEDIMTKERH
jgi:hypothetical protein